MAQVLYILLMGLLGILLWSDLCPIMPNHACYSVVVDGASFGCCSGNGNLLGR